jgi:hypothetical protein
VHTTGSRPKLVVSADGCGVVSHVGSRLLADLADVTGLTGVFSDALCRLRSRARPYPGVVKRARHRSRSSAISAMWWMNSRLAPDSTAMNGSSGSEP